MTVFGTNLGAMVALETLTAANSDMQLRESRISSGLRVSSLDNTSEFAIAQGIRSNLQGYATIQQGLGLAKSAVGVGIAATTGVSNALPNLLSLAQKIADPNTTSADRQTYADQVTAQLQSLQGALNGASFNGINLVSSSGKDLSVTTSLSGSQTTLAAPTAIGTQLDQLVTDITKTKGNGKGKGNAPAIDLTTTSGGTALYNALTSLQDTVTKGLGTLGADNQSAGFLSTFVQSISDATSRGLGALVNANLATESAKLTADQLQVQLATQVFSIANQQPAVLLPLFQSPTKSSTTGLAAPITSVG